MKVGLSEDASGRMRERLPTSARENAKPANVGRYRAR